MAFFKRTKQPPSNTALLHHNGQTKQTAEASRLSDRLDQNLHRIREQTGHSRDIIIRTLSHMLGSDHTLAVIYIDGLVDTLTINHSIMQSLTSKDYDEELHTSDPAEILSIIKNRFLSIGSISDLEHMEPLISAILEGNTVILIDGSSHGVIASSIGGEERGVEEPQSQTVVRGPKEGFTENIRTNTALIRRKIKSPNLWIVDRKIGRVTQTDVAVMYLNGIANDKIVQEILNRLDRIDTDSILESGYIEEFIQDTTFTPFPTITNTERPDAIAGAILEGKIAILVDGTPFALIAPITIFKLFQSSEDYYQKFDIATFLRLLRIISFVVSMLLPSLYIAISTFHQEMLPTTLLISLAAQREGIPFPAVVEALAMEITFEVLREAPCAHAQGDGFCDIHRRRISTGSSRCTGRFSVSCHGDHRCIYRHRELCCAFREHSQLRQTAPIRFYDIGGNFRALWDYGRITRHADPPSRFAIIRFAVSYAVRSIYPVRPKRRAGASSMVGHGDKTHLNQS